MATIMHSNLSTLAVAKKGSKMLTVRDSRQVEAALDADKNSQELSDA